MTTYRRSRWGRHRAVPVPNPLWVFLRRIAAGALTVSGVLVLVVVASSPAETRPATVLFLTGLGAVLIGAGRYVLGPGEAWEAGGE